MTVRSLLGILLLWTAAFLLPAPETTAQPAQPPIFQLRTYYTAPDKLPVLLERFRASNLPLFKKHGIKLVGAWTPLEADDAGDRLVYLVRFDGLREAEAAWKAFSDDPEWKDLFAKEKETHGTVVTRAETTYLSPTSYSPFPAPVEGEQEGPGRVYQLRIYHPSPDRLRTLNERFRDHTVKLFEKHGMTNVFYGVPTGGNPGDARKLTYLLSHPGREEAEASWKAFRDDPQWQEVYKRSQPDGVPLAAKVESYYLKPTAFSGLR